MPNSSPSKLALWMEYSSADLDKTFLSISQNLIGSVSNTIRRLILVAACPFIGAGGKGNESSGDEVARPRRAETADDYAIEAPFVPMILSEVKVRVCAQSSNCKL